MTSYECVSFILNKKDKILLERRADNKKTEPGRVTIPGGHIEKGETQVQALTREVEEELGIQATDFTYLCTLENQAEELQIVHYYSINSWKGMISCFEADALLWSPITDQRFPERTSDKLALKQLMLMRA
ncbi:NUDIX domain-containing protein [Vibrio sp. T187]|uniref:NUDIX hydrolase n=1 Tax=Vibrio TaxID=662 RepID=UPI0010C97119|nr:MULTISPECIES: NUDIX domain-containing protein [Vibrio]MBW3698478.1 NUDIX domain-containing protein [Vibrio sp. T187]